MKSTPASSFRLVRLIAAALVLLVQGTPAGAEPPIPLQVTGLNNAFRVTGRLFCGSHPEGEAAFAELARLGVKTIVSVDGNKPDLASAHKYGLRYIHLPFGYDGVPLERIVELSALAAAQTDPIYVHCRNGRYRAPAAVAVMCEATAGWTPDEAEAWLKRAGKGNVYDGLALSVREFKQPAPEKLARVGELPEVAKTSALVDAMVAIDGCFEALSAAQKAAWHPPASHPLPPAQAATQMLEQFQELVRADDTGLRPPDYRAKLGDVEKAVAALRGHLGEPPTDPRMLDAALNQVGQSCSACHKIFRNKRNEPK